MIGRLRERRQPYPSSVAGLFRSRVVGHLTVPKHELARPTLMLSQALQELCVLAGLGTLTQRSRRGEVFVGIGAVSSLHGTNFFIRALQTRHAELQW